MQLSDPHGGVVLLRRGCCKSCKEDTLKSGMVGNDYGGAQIDGVPTAGAYAQDKERIKWMIEEFGG
uniref:Uncharacterized protein n=1 Tax=Leersia perrieri TaxID=77586 RepID=A0A0D9VHV7_9ORYZ